MTVQTINPAGGPGRSTEQGFFAIGKPQWQEACALGMNPAVAFLIMARGTGKDNATTSWSAEAVFTHSGITWRRAKKAIDMLCEEKLVTRIARTPPRYKLAKPKDTDDLIWLPNEIVTGAGNEIPPITRLRQTQEVEVLQLFVELYGEHELLGDGGLPRTLLYQHFEREKIMDWGPYSVYGFDRPQSRFCKSTGPLARFRNRKDGEGSAWDRLGTLEQLGLIEWVDYLAESTDPDAELIHALSGDMHAEEVADTVSCLADELPGGYKYEAPNYEYVIPVIRHLEKAAVVGVARLRYRPKTSRTAAWWGQHIEVCRRFVDLYSRLERGEFKVAV